MADEIAIRQTLTAKGATTPNLTRSVSYNADAGNDFSGEIASIPTTAAGTALTVAAAVGTKGWAYFRNVDATNFVDIGVQVAATFYPFARLMPGEECHIPLSPAVALFALANTAAVRLDYGVIER